jgi:alkanesulfonate monooxygenase SsuD/methylene tetrahydromethanopterin reductase-like flavin-dependent oxidoreductase (luciferase family)
VQRPRVPLLIAGGGERVTLRQVAQYADLSNFGPHHTIGSAFTLEDVRRKVAALASHCLERGRPLESVLRTHSTMPLILADTPAALERKLAGMNRPARYLPGSSTIAGTPEDVIPYYRALVEAGLRYFIAWIVGDDRETVRLFAERVLPALRGS